MMNTTILTMTFLLAAIVAAAQPASFDAVETVSWCDVGDDKIAVRTFRYGSASKYVFVNLHHNETTAIEAAQNKLSEAGGVLIHIENENERLISFKIGNRTFRFDPNRIFTEAGIRKTLAQLNHIVTTAALKAVRKFAAFMKTKLPATPAMIIAVHNNEDGDLSINSYAHGGSLQREALHVNREAGRDADDFFLTTSQTLFRKIKTAGHNVVLQHNGRATDDGSLSIYYGRKKKIYVNVEAESGHLAEQEAMIGLLIDISNK